MYESVHNLIVTNVKIFVSLLNLFAAHLALGLWVAYNSKMRGGGKDYKCKHKNSRAMKQ